MPTRRYETCILYPGMTPIPADARHSPQAAVALARTLALKHYRYLGEGTYWDVLALKLGAVSEWEISTQLLSIHASTSGALLGTSRYVTCAALFTGGFQRRVERAFPGARVLSVILNNSINDFAFAIFRGNEKRRLWSMSHEGRDWEKGEVVPEELSALQLAGAKRALARRPLDEEDDEEVQVVVGGEIYDLDDVQNYFEMVVDKLQQRYIEPSEWDRPGGCSWFVRRPWWRIHALV